ncbi:acetate--CoA ligase family protein [Desulfospira joergensenii]|uniref:acetate--CoA ligase family protein n=1 Tax=Desulfospira joergensenii TaxID=53329 RepID=UPI0003B3A335|nr:acetate--CoA ligase family protein [Desulfospira joergensenii]
MDIPIDFDSITRLLEGSARQGRYFLYEDEVYRLLARSGAETPPGSRMIQKGDRLSDEDLTAIPGSRTVLKIVSPMIVHKTEVGGVSIVEKDAHKIRSAVRRMFHEVPENYARWIRDQPREIPDSYKGLDHDGLVRAVDRDIKGILQVQFMPPDSEAFGNELIVGLRHTREFGTILSAGLGGTDTELYARRFRKGQAIVACSIHMNDGRRFFEIFKQTISYRKLAGLTRGQRRIVTDGQLIECFESFIRIGRFYSPLNPKAPFVIDELEINPFAFTDYLMVPLDGLCRFSDPGSRPAGRPVAGIHSLLHPRTMGIIGVSVRRRNFGRIILDNVLAEGFPKEDLVIFREGTEEIKGISCLPRLSDLDRKLDLLIVAVGAKKVPNLVEEILRLDAARSVMLIPGGMGETEETRGRAEQVGLKIEKSHSRDKGGPVFLGANSMGVISKPGRYDTWFIPEEKLPKQRGNPACRAALISQSGAFMLLRTHQRPELAPAYMISMGNQTDLTLGDMIHYFKDSDQVDVIAVYAEGFKDLDGLEFCRGVRQAVLAGKEVVFYKAGRTPEGKAATGSHTASLAGDYMVCESCVSQAGAVVARNFTEFQDLMLLAETLGRKQIRGRRLAAVSGAGFEAVGMADSIQSDDFQMELAEFGGKTRERIAKVLEAKGLEDLVTLANPLDINPGADDLTHAEITGILVRDPNVDAVVLSLDPMSPAMKTLEKSRGYDMNHENGILNLITDLAQRSLIPIVTVVDGGRLYDPLRDGVMARGVPVFTTCDRAVAALSLHIQGRLRAHAIRSCRDKPGA